MATLIRFFANVGGLIVGAAGVCRATASGSEADVDRDWEDGTDRNQEDGTRRVTE
jgi:hypothetical protein